jgi:hypothetical protein
MEVMMRRIWPIIYFVGAISAVYTGYSELQPNNTAKTNADWIFVTVSFVTMLALPMLSVAFARHRGVEEFRRPSFTRSPLGWWSDTLQPIRLTLIGLLCSASGAAVALPNTNAQGVMLFWWLLSMSLGLLVGARIAYAWLGDRVIASSECAPSTPPVEPFAFYLLGIVFLSAGYVSATSDRLLIWWNQREQIFIRAEHPVIFICLTLAMFAIGGVFIAIGVFHGRRWRAG